MNRKSKIKAFFDSKQEKATYIDKYEENLDFFNDLLINGHKEDIEFVIPITMYNYADSLNQTGNYSKALTVLLEVEKDLEKIRGQSKWYNQYLEGVTFLKGVCLGRLKRYKDSNVEFEKVLRKNPTNDNFIDWYKSNKKNEIGRILDRIAVVAVGYYVIVVIADFLGYEIENIVVRDIGLVVGLISFVVSYLWKKMIDKKPLKFE
jgi:tetratricopeptide (TPR) repeat protein